MSLAAENLLKEIQEWLQSHGSINGVPFCEEALATRIDEVMATRDYVQQAAASAVATLQGQGYTFHGGEVWKPPVKPVVAWLKSDGSDVITNDKRQTMLDHLGQGGVRMANEYVTPLSKTAA